jgi:hypothetical protein
LMDMIRWLASNIVVQVAWGLGLLAVLLAFLFGGSKSAEEHATAEPKTATVETEVVAKVAAPVVVATAAVAAVASDVKEEVEPVQAVAATPVAEVVEQEVTEEVATTEPPVEVEVSSEAEVVEAPVVEEAQAVEATLDTSSLEGKSSEDLLMMAREAYWNNGLDEAAELYGVLIEREPSVIEHKGELGNVFWRQGFPKKAAELYAEIAEPMIEKGNGERVSNMVGFIGLFFPERATAIRGLLTK